MRGPTLLLVALVIASSAAAPLSTPLPHTQISIGSLVSSREDAQAVFAPVKSALAAKNETALSSWFEDWKASYSKKNGTKSQVRWG